MIKALLIFALTVATLQPTRTDAAPAVRYADGRITVDVRDADLVDVLGEITRQAKLEVRGTPTAQRLSIRLEAVPLTDALSRLLQEQSFDLTYDGAGELKGVRFVSAASSKKSPDSTPEAPAPDGSVAPIDRPVHVDGLLATALGADVTDFTTIVGVALESGDARLRAAALRAGLGALDADPELRTDVLGRLDAMDDVAAADRLTEVARDNAGEMARQTARLAHWGALRRRAAAIARLLGPSGRTN